MLADSCKDVNVDLPFHFPQLLHYGKEYPLGFDYFKPKMKAAFTKNKDVTDPEKLQQLLDHGSYIVKELEALYMLRKYRTLKRRYNKD